MKPVFISYASEDTKTALRVCEVLEGHGVPCWIAPRDIAPGANWPAEIMRAIRSSRALVLVGSAHVNRSDNVFREVTKAAESKIRLFLFRTQNFALSEQLEYFFMALHWFDAWSGALEAKMDELAHRLREFLATEPTVGPPRRRETVWRAFDPQEELVADLFAFDLDAVLLRAAKRRGLGLRKRVGALDLVAGLLRKGDLTRTIAHELKTDPDDLYDRLLRDAASATDHGEEAQDAEQKGPGERGAGADASHPGSPSQADSEVEWPIRHKRQFTKGAVAILLRADACAQARAGGNARISEHDLLDGLTEGDKWAADPGRGAPSAADVRRLLLERERAGVLDENGWLRLNHLTEGARRVVERGHFLAQRLGIPQITNRVMLAAFLENDERHAARLCRRAGRDRELLFLVMLASSQENVGSREGRDAGLPAPNAFTLNLETCTRIVAPMLFRATEIAADPGAITEAELFVAFCDQTPPQFKAALRQAPLSMDLDQLARADDGPGKSPATAPPTEVSLLSLSPSAKTVVDTVHALAQQKGVFPISNRLFLTALLADKNGFAARVCRHVGVDPTALTSVLCASIEEGQPRSFGLSPEACERAVLPILNEAARLTGEAGTVTEAALFKAFCRKAPPALRKSLRHCHAAMDLDRLEKIDPPGEKV